MPGSIFWLLLISECYLQHSVQTAKGLASLISSHFKPLCRCLTKPGDSTFFRWSWFLIQLSVAAIPTRPVSRRQTCCCLLWTFHTCPPPLPPSPVRTFPVPPWWSWHIISSCASKNKQAVCQKGLVVVCQFYLVVCSPILWEEKGVRITLARNVRLKKPLFFRGT